MAHKKAEMQQHRLFDQLISIRMESYGVGREGLCVMVGFVRYTMVCFGLLGNGNVYGRLTGLAWWVAVLVPSASSAQKK